MYHWAGTNKALNMVGYHGNPVFFLERDETRSQIPKQCDGVPIEYKHMSHTPGSTRPTRPTCQDVCSHVRGVNRFMKVLAWLIVIIFKLPVLLNKRRLEYNAYNLNNLNVTKGHRTE